MNKKQTIFLIILSIISIILLYQGIIINEISAALSFFAGVIFTKIISYIIEDENE